MKQDDIIELNIEKIVYGGAGLAHYQNFTFFIKNTCPGDKVKARITKLNKTWGEAELVEIVKSSEYRIKPICPIFNACGSCNLQFIDYNFQLQQKELILKEAFKSDSSIKFLPIEKSPKIIEFRSKVQYPVEVTKNSKRLLVGYYREKSHKLTNIKFCPIQPAIADEIVEFIRANWNLGAKCNYDKEGLLRNILIRISSNIENISLVLVVASDKLTKSQDIEIKKFAEKITKKFPQIKSVNLNFNSNDTNTILGENTQNIIGYDYIEEHLSKNNKTKLYKIGATSFFQTNPFVASSMFEYINSLLQSDKTLLDAYGGVGSIGIWASDSVSKITLVEENKNAIRFAKENFKLNNVKNYEIFEGDAKIIFNNFFIKKQVFDCVILDPPRKGADKKALHIISKITKKIVYTSCNPQTLARDVEYLKQYGFKLVSLKPFDMFPHTHHMETVALLLKEENA